MGLKLPDKLYFCFKVLWLQKYIGQSERLLSIPRKKDILELNPKLWAARAQEDRYYLDREPTEYNSESICMVLSEVEADTFCADEIKANEE